MADQTWLRVVAESGSRSMSRRDLMRRSLVLGAGLSLTSLLAACGDDDDADPTSGDTTGGTDTTPGTTGTAAPEAEGTAAEEETAEGGDSGSTDGEPAAGGSITIALNSDLTTMDPHISTAAVDRQVYQLIYDKLVDIDEGLNIIPELAESWEISDDGMEYTFVLVAGVTFHDGDPFNAEAAKANFDRMLDDATASPRKSEIAQVTEVVATDETTLTLTLSQPFSPLLATLSDRAGMMISPKAIVELGADLARQPVGTGAFTFVEWVKDDHLTVQKTENWWKPDLPYLDEVTYKPIVDASVRLTTLQTNDVQMMDQISAKDVETVSQDDSLVYGEVGALGFTYIAFNTLEAPFDTMALRQACAWCIDRDAINETLFFGTGSPIQTPIPPSSWAYDESVQVYTQDYAQAQAMLDEGGMPDGFEFTMLVTNSPDAIQLAEAYKAQLSEANITCEIELLEFGTLLDRTNNGDFQAVSLGWSGRPDPDGNIYNYFHSEGGNNRGGYANPDVDALLEQTRSEADQAARKALYTEVTTLIAEEAPMIFVRVPAESKVWQPSIKGFVHIPDGMMRMDSVWLDQS